MQDSEFKVYLYHSFSFAFLERTPWVDTTPTLFAHNKDKQPHKRKSSELREEAKAKHQLCEDAVENHELFQRFDFECNTKGIQTDGEITPLKVDIGVQCNIEFTQHEEHNEPALSSESETARLTKKTTMMIFILKTIRRIILKI